MTNARLELRPTARMIKAGAIVMRRLEKSEHESLLHATGFENISAEVTQIHSPNTIVGLAGAGAVQMPAKFLLLGPSLGPASP